MTFLLENPVTMVAALLVASILGGIIGFILRGWQDERRATRSKEEPARPTVGRTAYPATGPSAERGWGDAGADGPPVTAEGRGDGDGPLVLLVDDRLELLALHSAYLHRHGYTVLTAGDGDTALDFAREHHPAVIVLDHSMPRRTGLEVARELKGDPATARIPILMMTAHSYGAVGAAAKEVGCETFLPKPIDPSRMLREVAAWAPPQRTRGHGEI